MFYFLFAGVEIKCIRWYFLFGFRCLLIVIAVSQTVSSAALKVNKLKMESYFSL